MRINRTQTKLWSTLLIASCVFMGSTTQAMSGPPGYESKEKEERQRQEKEMEKQKKREQENREQQEKFGKDARKWEEKAKADEKKYRDQNWKEKWVNFMEEEYYYQVRPEMRRELKEDIARTWGIDSESLHRHDVREWLDRTVAAQWATPAHARYREVKGWDAFQNQEQDVIRRVANETAKKAKEGYKYEDDLKHARKKVDGQRVQEREQMRKNHDRQMREELALKYQGQFQQHQAELARRQAQIQRTRARIEAESREKLKTAKKNENHFQLPSVQKARSQYDKVLQDAKKTNQYDSPFSKLQ